MKGADKESKEHVVTTGDRPVEEQEEIKELPNVHEMLDEEKGKDKDESK